MARANRMATPGDMIRSLAVILIPLLIIAALFTNVPKDKAVAEVDWRPALVTARREAPFTVLAPANLPEGWRATQVEWVQKGDPYRDGQPAVRNLWSLGFLTPDQVFVGLDQGDGPAEDLIEDQTRDGTGDGQSTVAGQTWERRLSPDRRTRSLVRTEPTVTSIVSGDLPYEALDAYAATLAAS